MHEFIRKQTRYFRSVLNVVKSEPFGGEYASYSEANWHQMASSVHLYTDRKALNLNKGRGWNKGEGNGKGLQRGFLKI